MIDSQYNVASVERTLHAADVLSLGSIERRTSQEVTSTAEVHRLLEDGGQVTTIGYGVVSRDLTKTGSKTQGFVHRYSLVPACSRALLERKLGIVGQFDSTGSVERDLRTENNKVAIDNFGEGLMFPDGRPIAGVKLTFKLGNNYDSEENTVDATTGNIVALGTSAYTNERGEFSVQLWPNDRGVHMDGYPSVYQVTSEPKVLQPGFIYIHDMDGAPLKFSTLWSRKNRFYPVRKHVGVPVTVEVVTPTMIPCKIKFKGNNKALVFVEVKNDSKTTQLRSNSCGCCDRDVYYQPGWIPEA